MMDSVVSPFDSSGNGDDRAAPVTPAGRSAARGAHGYVAGVFGASRFLILAAVVIFSIREGMTSPRPPRGRGDGGVRWEAWPS